MSENTHTGSDQRRSLAVSGPKVCSFAIGFNLLSFLTFAKCFGQQYVLSTLAGGAPPLTPAPATSVSFYLPSGVAVDPAGNVLLAAINCVFRVEGNTISRVAGNSRGGFSGDGRLAVTAQLGLSAVSPGGGMTVDAAGNIYIADSGNARIRKISTSGIITTVAGNGTITLSGDGGPAVNGSVGNPDAVAVDGSRNVFIADWAYGTVRKVSSDGIIKIVAGGGAGAMVDGAPATSVSLLHPAGLAVDRSGNLFISDTGNNSIREVSPTGIITTIAGTGSSGFSGDGGAATAATFAGPSGLAFDASGNLYIADTLNNRIRKIPSDGTITTIAGGGKVFPGNNVQAKQASLLNPCALAFDADGNLYVAAGWIQKISTSGIISVIAGDGLYSYGGDGGPALNAQFYAPADVAIDGSGNVYIADSENNLVRRVDTSGIITTLAGTGTCGSSGDGGSALKAMLCLPQGLATDGAGNVYIAESHGSRIRKVSPNGTISTVAGNGVTGFSGDGGQATAAALDYPIAVAVDGTGNLFISDYGSSRIRKVSPAGIISTIAGNGTFGFSGDDGPAVNAVLAAPASLAVDAAGDLFIADRANGRVRKIGVDGIISTVAGGGYPDDPYSSSNDGEPAVGAGIFVEGIALDTAGTLYISDDIKGRIFKVASDATIRSVAGNGGTSISADGEPANDAALGWVGTMRVDPSGHVYFVTGGSIRVLEPVNQSIIIGAVVDAASENVLPISPGKIVIVYGVGLGPVQLVSNQPSGGIYSTQVAGTTVAVNGIAAPLLYSSATQVSAIVPYGVTGSTAQITVSYQNVMSDSVSIPMAASAPAIFSFNGTGAGQAAALNGDGSLNDAAHPVEMGGYLSLYATGEGQTTPSGIDGKVAASAPPLPQPKLPVSVTVGGQTAAVIYAGAAPSSVAGLMQVVIQIPPVVPAGGYVPVVLQVGNVSTMDGALWIAVSGATGSN